MLSWNGVKFQNQFRRNSDLKMWSDINLQRYTHVRYGIRFDLGSNASLNFECFYLLRSRRTTVDCESFSNPEPMKRRYLSQAKNQISQPGRKKRNSFLKTLTNLTRQIDAVVFQTRIDGGTRDFFVISYRCTGFVIEIHKFWIHIKCCGRFHSSHRPGPEQIIKSKW